MKNNIIKALFIALPAISAVTQAQANPWWWPGKPAAKTVQLALPSTNGALVSVTVPSKTASAKRSTTGHHGARELAITRARDAANLRDDERIAADLERHF